MLQVASCIGDDIDVSTLLLVLDWKTDDITTSLDVGVREHLLMYLPDQGCCRFVHDRIQAAAQSCISDSDILSYQIGQKLLSQSSPIVLSASLCTIANLINKGIERINNQNERYNIAALNFQAGEKASALHSFPEAAEYFQTGINLLPETACWEEKYDLTLKLYNAAAEAELCKQNFTRVWSLASDILKRAQTFDDKLPAYIAQIYAAGQNGSLEEAMDLGVNVVQQLDVDIPSIPTDLKIVKNLVKTSVLLCGKSDATILALPLMRDEKKRTAVHILNMLVLYAVQSGSPLLPFLASKLVQLCLRYGLAKGCTHGFALYAFLVARFSKRKCYRFGRLALTMVEKLRAREMIPCVHSVAYFECHHWVHPLKESFAPLKKCIQIGLDLGDVEYVCLASLFHGILAVYSGMSLTKAQGILVEASDRMKRYQQNNFQQIVDVHLQATCALLRDDVPLINTIQTFSAGDDANHKLASVYRYSWAAALAYHVGDFSQAVWSKRGLA